MFDVESGLESVCELRLEVIIYTVFQALTMKMSSRTGNIMGLLNSLAEGRVYLCYVRTAYSEFRGNFVRTRMRVVLLTSQSTQS